MPPAPVSTLETHAGYWLRFVSNHVSHGFRRKVESHGATVAEWVVMRALLDSDGVNPSELAESIGLTRGAVSRLIDRLVAKRLVSCRCERDDRRYQIVKLTAAGRRLVPVLAELADENDAEFFGHLSVRERTALVGVLQGIVERHGLKGAPLE